MERYEPCMIVFFFNQGRQGERGERGAAGPQGLQVSDIIGPVAFPDAVVVLLKMNFYNCSKFAAF